MTSQHLFQEGTINLTTAQELKDYADNRFLGTSNNQYIEDVSHLPVYDENDPSHVVVSLFPTGNEKSMNSTTFNDTVNGWQHFFILPGDYRSLGQIEITESGIDSVDGSGRKTVQLLKSYLDTSQHEHPAQLDDSENCFIQFKNRGSYWTFDRMRLDSPGADNRLILKASEHNIVNRAYGTDIAQACITITGKSHYSTVQNSRFVYADDHDTIAVNIKVSGDFDYEDADDNQYYSAMHCKVIRNEFVDCGDGFQASAGAFGTNGFYTYGNVGGLVLDNNDFYITDTLNKENATDTKCGSPSADPFDFLSNNGYDNPYFPCQISNNRAWGFNDAGTEKAADAFISSMYSNGWKIFNNVTFDCTVSMSGGSNSSSTGIFIGYEDSEMYNNISYDCGDEGRADDRYNQPMRYNNGRNQKIYDNYFIQPRSERIAKFADMRDGSSFENNKIVEPLNNNWYVLNSTPVNDQSFISSQTTNSEVSRTEFTDYNFQKDKFTNEPVLVTLPNILDPNGTIISPIDTNVVFPKSSYLADVSIEEYDSGNPEHFLIENNLDWSEINSTTYKNFYVVPGDYSSLGEIEITKSGDANNRRSISLYNGNDTHPAKFADRTSTYHAQVRLLFNNASYWDIDRISYIAQHAGNLMIHFKFGSTNNTVNRLYTYDAGTTIQINHLSHNNTIQNSRFEEAYEPGGIGLGQSSAILLQASSSGSTPVGEVYNTKILNNEFFNQNDGIVLESPIVDTNVTHFDGTIIDENTFEKDRNNLENAIDFKGGSSLTGGLTNPIIVSNNVMWGYKEDPNYVPGTGYSAGTVAMNLHYGMPYLEIYDNIVFDSGKGIALAPDYTRFYKEWTTIGSSIRNNVIYQCGEETTTGNGEKLAIEFIHTRDTEFKENYLIDSTWHEFYMYNNDQGSLMIDNKVVNPNEGTIEYYKYTGREYGDSEFIASMASTTIESNTVWNDYKFYKNKLTNTPTLMTLPNILDPNGSIISPA